MPFLEALYLLVAIVTFLVLLLFSRSLPSAFRVVTFGKEKSVEAVSLELRKTLLQQLKVSFWAMIISGAVALSILAVALLKGVLFTNWSDVSGVVGIVAGLGDSALFGFFYKIWRDCQAGLRSVQ